MFKPVLILMFLLPTLAWGNTLTFDDGVVSWEFSGCVGLYSLTEQIEGVMFQPELTYLETIEICDDIKYTGKTPLDIFKQVSIKAKEAHCFDIQENESKTVVKIIGMESLLPAQSERIESQTVKVGNSKKVEVYSKTTIRNLRVCSMNSDVFDYTYGELLNSSDR